MNSDQVPGQFDSTVGPEGLHEHRVSLPWPLLGSKDLKDPLFCHDQAVTQGSVVGLWFHNEPPVPSMESCVTTKKREKSYNN